MYVVNVFPYFSVKPKASSLVCEFGELLVAFVVQIEVHPVDGIDLASTGSIHTTTWLCTFISKLCVFKLKWWSG